MDHVDVKNIVIKELTSYNNEASVHTETTHTQTANSSIVSVPTTNIISDQVNDSTSGDVETLFWYRVLYAIGSYMIDNFTSLETNDENLSGSISDSINNPIINNQPITNHKTISKKFVETIPNKFIKKNSRKKDMISQTEQCSVRATVKTVEDIKYENLIQRIFCGYWILYTIATMAENTEQQSR
ncbi:Hypothetical protein HVR_LOCUS1223 [uncultured virus]|nr:Hypothetical protein HVR_LOCUS1223 [uncultured virus]